MSHKKDLLESFVPVVRLYGLKTEKAVSFTNTVSIEDSLTLGGANAITLDGTETNLLSFGSVAGSISGSPGTLTATHKIAVNIAGVGTRYIHVGTVA
jgi:hypothetical protein